MMTDTLSPTTSPTLAIIVAMDKHRGIGKDNKLLWHIPEDLQYFKRMTMGKPLIMGRKTFESIGRPLPGRFSIVITQQCDWHFDGVGIAHSFEQAVSTANNYIDENNRENDNCASEIMVVGGEQIYRLAMPFAKRIYLTEVDTCLPADAFFPEIENSQWRLLSKSPIVTTNTGYSLLHKVFTHV